MEIVESKEAFILKKFPYCSGKDFISNKIETIYKHLADEESIYVFNNRLLFSLTKDFGHLRNIVLSTEGGNSFNALINQYIDERKVYIYGAGTRGLRLPHIYTGLKKITGYIDKKKCGTYEGIRVYKLDEIGEISNSIVLVSNTTNLESIQTELQEKGIREQNIILMSNYEAQAAKYRYFDNSCIKSKPDASKWFVDVGSFDGMDTIKYLQWQNVPAKILVLEADSQNFIKCKNNLQNMDEVKLLNIGVSNRKSSMFFSSKNSVGSRIENEMDDNSNRINVVSLDEICRHKEIGYIKMDIEGEEKKALIGAKKIIEEQKPMLAISVYHKEEDIWEIPYIILQYNQNYKFFLRHYSLGVTDTVLYAIPD